LLRGAHMTDQEQPPIEHELLRQATLAEIVVADTQINPTSADDKHVRIEGRLGLDEDDDGEPANEAEHYAFGFIYALGVLSSQAWSGNTRATTTRTAHIWRSIAMRQSIVRSNRKPAGASWPSRASVACIIATRGQPDHFFATTGRRTARATTIDAPARRPPLRSNKSRFARSRGLRRDGVITSSKRRH
jgi:hypothetical protein